MREKFTPLLLVILLALSSCLHDTPQIRVACDSSSSGTMGAYTVKWELFPPKDGKVKIYSSYDPEFSTNTFVEEKPISEGFSIIRRENEQRQFFHLVFDKKYSAYVAERNINTDRINNLRDMGGYYRGKSRQVKWAKLYRSSSLSWLSEKDKVVLDSLHIKTILDLRNESNRKRLPSRYEAEETICLNLHVISIDTIRRKIMEGQMKKGDVLICQQDMYANIIDQDTAALAKAFDILTDESKYPILYHCFQGKDHTGLLSIFILEALGVDREQILHDYMASNQHIDFRGIISKISELPHEAEEPMATLLTVNEQTFNYIYDKIRRDYGSMQQYLTKTLRVNEKKREKLREILFYP